MKRNGWFDAMFRDADKKTAKDGRYVWYGRKRILAAILSVCIAAGPVAEVTGSVTVQAAQPTEQSLLSDMDDGLLPVETESPKRNDSREDALTGLSGNAEESGEKRREDAKTSLTDMEASRVNAESRTEKKDTDKNVRADDIAETGEAEEASADRELPTGLLATEVVPLSAREVANNEIVASREFLSTWKESRAAHTYSSEWDKYKSYYYYNQLEEEERELWDALEAIAYKCMTTQTNVSYTADGGVRYYHLDTVSSFTLNRVEMYRVVRLFRISNPQYYFLNNIVLTGSNGFSSVIAMGVYSKFANGAVRAQETARVKAQVEAWMKQVNAYPDDEQKVRKIYDLIIDRVDYNYPSLEPGADEDKEYTQTAYSAICLPLTVCAGYSQAFTMVCNGVGIDAVSVTSADHQWNKVRINDSWYNLDLTWGDSGEGKPTSYQYFDRNDQYYDNDHPELAQSHSEETDYVSLGSGTGIPMWSGLLPVCNLDSNPAAPYTAPGSVPVITETTAKPEIVARRDGDEIEVVIKSATPGAVIYYSKDGKTVPSPASIKCERYTEPLVLEKGAKIQAVAVCDAKLDSAAVQKSVEVKTIKFNGNGSGSGSMGSVTYLAGSGQKLPANKFKRSYYTFTGWNTKKDGKGTSYSDKQLISAFPSGTGSTITLYAQWKKTSYKITYNLNGGKNNSKNPASYTHWTATIRLKNPTRTGYKFGGWYTDKKCTKKVTEIKKGSSGKVTLYAKWTANKYTISFNGNGSTSGKMNALSSRKYGKSYKLTANKFKRTGYTFVGWNTKKNGKGKSYSDKQSVKNLTSKANGKVTLYAQWKKTTYKIVYNLNGGKNNSKNPDTYTYTTATIRLKAPTRKGYTFVGWYSDKKCTKKVTQIKKGTTGKITLYAKWKKK